MKRDKSQIVVACFFLSFIMLIITIIGLKIYCDTQSAIRHTYAVSKDNLNTAQEDLLIAITVSKQWQDLELSPEKPTGAQYDGVLINDSGYVFKDWMVTLNFSEPLYIDSSWNGDFTNENMQVIFSAKDESSVVKAKSLATFGAIMYSENILQLDSYTLEGYRVLNMKKLTIFKVLVLLCLLWCISLIIYSTIHFKTVVYRKRLELDSKIILQSMNTLTGFIDAKDVYTRNHSTRVAIYSAELGRRLKMSKDEVDSLYYIALMHDCGKIGIPDKVLNHPGKLNAEEYKLIQSHPTIGDRLLSDFTAIPNIRDGAHYHHEHFDGNGYPEGLKGEDIPLCARIICVADAFDAMSSDRCYRKSMNKEEIVKELIACSGTQFDPKINPIMISMIEEGFIIKIQEKYPIT